LLPREPERLPRFLRLLRLLRRRRRSDVELLPRVERAGVTVLNLDI
jgi:hypothetical protein